MPYFKTTDYGNVKSIWILYWQDSQLVYNRNNYWTELEDLHKQILRYSKFFEITNFDYRHSNTNRRTYEWQQNKNWVERYRDRKSKGIPLIIINESEEIHVNRNQVIEDIRKLYTDLVKMIPAK